MPQKRTEHIIHPDEIEIGPFQLQLLFGKSFKEGFELYLGNIFCECGIPTKSLVDYKSYLNNLNDVTLRGRCSGCGNIAIRYIETGERPGIDKIANKIRSLNKS